MSTKNHQGRLNDSTDESDGKMFEAINSSRCPVRTIENFLKHGLPVPTAEGAVRKIQT